MREHKSLHSGQPHVHTARVSSYLTEPCFDYQTVERFSVGHDPGSGKASCRVSADMLSKRIDDSNVIWTHDSPDAEQHAAARNEYSAHFAERRRSVGKELKTLLTQDDIKRGVREIHGHGAAFNPSDWRPGRRWQGACDRQHSRVEIQARDSPSQPNCWRSQARDHPRAAGQVQHTLSEL
jgi:hypothetical protein